MALVNQDAPALIYLYTVFHLNSIYIHESERTQLLKIVRGGFNHQFNKK